MFWIKVPYEIHSLQAFPPVLWAVFSLSQWRPLKPQHFPLDEASSNRFLLLLVLLLSYMRIFGKTQSHKESTQRPATSSAVLALGR